MLDRNGKKLTATGSCFENCAKWVIGDPSTEFVVVHCLVTGAGHIKGLEYAHAFLLDERVNLVIDVTLDINEPKVISADRYREIGNVREEIHYTREEVLAKIRETDHYGAWDDKLQTDVDRAVTESS